MASISTDRQGRKRILFVNGAGERKTIRLGKVSQRSAESMKYRVEALLESLLLKRPMDADLAGWVNDLEPVLSKRLARVGLIPKPEVKAAATLEAFVESYIDRRTDVSPHTRRIWRQTLRLLVDYFGANKPLADITRGEASDWRLSLVAADFADASVRKHCGFAKHFFGRAIDHELIAVNPFGKLVSAPVGNAARQYFVTRDETEKILAAAPDAEWRLVIALSRYGGLRCPSEHLALTWDDVDWERNRMTVRSPKTARHAGHESRVVPLFPELRPYLDEVQRATPRGTKTVLTRFRDDSNLRTQLTRIIKRAGLTPWPRITHNLRASRATELAADHPSHVAAAWLGHSALVAQKHYWQVTDADFQRAAGESGAKSGAQVAQNPAQHAHASTRTDSQCSDAKSCTGTDWNRTADPRRDFRGEPTEVHGNRTHLPGASALGTAVLKTVAATRRASTSRIRIPSFRNQF